MNTVISIVVFILYIAMVALNFYTATRGDLRKQVVTFIKEANKLNLLGKEKMDKVVDQLYEIVPAGFQKFFTKEQLRDKAQDVYNEMKDFANSENKKEEK